MSKDPSEQNGKSEEDDTLPSWVFALFLIGFVLVSVGIAVVMAASIMNGGSASGAVVIFIGPFPIVFGTAPGATWLVSTGIILTAISIIVFMVMRRKILKK